MHTRSSTPGIRRVFVIVNPTAGSCSARDVREAVNRHFSPPEPSVKVVECDCEIHETCHGEPIPEVVRDAVGRGFELIVAAGGDGTVSEVANGLVGTETPMGIVPLGTANVLARELGIPLALEDACALIAGPHRIRSIDAMQVGKRCYFTQVGIGLDAIMIRDTGREAKRRFGRIAYLWTAFKSLLGFQPRKFALTTDGDSRDAHASQVLVANSGILGQPPFRWGPDITIDDGRLDICIVRARNVWDYTKLAANVLLGRHKQSANVRYLTAERSIKIDTRRPWPVQGDGEIIGRTPVTVEVVPHAVNVVVPASTTPY